ncbi:MAG: hypothetical protein ACRC33_06920 [Gemmataceae bacterium]
MSTATPERTVAQDHARISSPLERLRKYIRSYVTLEGVGLAVLFLCVWFWAGLAFDWGLFKLSGVDLVQQLPWGFRAAVLAGLGGLLVTVLLFTVLFRLLVQFSDRTMAQVLEHRFPALLGDRLITAVELNDPAEAAKLGYSGPMVRQTIHDAAEQVEKVPVKEAFNWGRLVKRGVWCVALSAGLYLLVGVAVTAASPRFFPPKEYQAGFADVNETSAIWVERNILLKNTIWPRRAHLVVADFPDKLRIPKKSQPPVLRVKAWKYVVADAAQKEGWRQLTWADLKAKPAIAGDVPELPADWKPSDETAVDEVEARLEAFPVRTSLPDGVPLPAKWCVATAEAAFEGWKPLLWSDLTAEKLGGLPVPGLPAGSDPKGRVDDIEKRLSESPADAKGLEGVRMVFATLNRLNEVRDAVDRLDVKATARENKRSIRRLIVPAEVRLAFWSRNRLSEVRLDAVGDNEFTGSFGELDEDVTFTVRGEDYVTPPQTITVVERPQVERLESEESRPAYLYYRPGPDGKPSDVEIAGQRQPFAPLAVSVSGESTTVEPAVGTKLRLIAHFTKPVVSVTGHEVKKDKEEETFKAEPAGSEKDGGSMTYATPEFEVRREIKLTLRFTDLDGVTAERKVTVTPKPDLAPSVRDFNPDDVIRRDKVGYLITANARVPFKGRVTDDHGVGRVSYGVRVIPSDFLSEQKVRSLDGVAAVGLATTPLGALTQALPWLAKVRRDSTAAAGDEAVDEQTLALPDFQRQVKTNRQTDGSAEYLGVDTVAGRLKSPQRDPYRALLKSFALAPDNWTEQDGFAGENPRPADRVRLWVRPDDPDKAALGSDLGVWQLRWKDRDGKVLTLKDPDDTKPQKRFNVEVRLLADDTFLEGEVDPKTKRPVPHTTPSSETFTFVVVPENELLAKIGEEEEQKYRDLQKAFKPLPEGLDRLRDIAFALSGDVPANDITAFVARCDALAEALRTSEQETKGVYEAYRRIVQEMRLNQVSSRMQEKVYGFILVPLEAVSERLFKRTIDGVDELRRRLASDAPRAEREKIAGEAKKDLNDLVTAINGVLAAMEGINTINALIADLARIEKQEEDLQSLVTRVQRQRLKELLSD